MSPIKSHHIIHNLKSVLCYKSYSIFSKNRPKNPKGGSMKKKLKMYCCIRPNTKKDEFIFRSLFFLSFFALTLCSAFLSIGVLCSTFFTLGREKGPTFGLYFLIFGHIFLIVLEFCDIPFFGIFLCQRYMWPILVTNMFD